MTFLTTFLEIFDWGTDIKNVQIYKNSCDDCMAVCNNTHFIDGKFYFQNQYSIILIIYRKDELCTANVFRALQGL
jgi:hypothetical protein